MSLLANNTANILFLPVSHILSCSYEMGDSESPMFQMVGSYPFWEIPVYKIYHQNVTFH